MLKYYCRFIMNLNGNYSQDDKNYAKYAERLREEDPLITREQIQENVRQAFPFRKSEELAEPIPLLSEKSIKGLSTSKPFADVKAEKMYFQAKKAVGEKSSAFWIALAIFAVVLVVVSRTNLLNKVSYPVNPVLVGAVNHVMNVIAGGVFLVLFARVVYGGRIPIVVTAAEPSKQQDETPYFDRKISELNKQISTLEAEGESKEREVELAQKRAIKNHLVALYQEANKLDDQNPLSPQEDQFQEIVQKGLSVMSPQENRELLKAWTEWRMMRILRDSLKAPSMMEYFAKAKALAASVKPYRLNFDENVNAIKRQTTSFKDYLQLCIAELEETLKSQKVEKENISGRLTKFEKTRTVNKISITTSDLRESFKVLREGVERLDNQPVSMEEEDWLKSYIVNQFSNLTEPQRKELTDKFFEWRVCRFLAHKKDEHIGKAIDMAAGINDPIIYGDLQKIMSKDKRVIDFLKNTKNKGK